VIVSCTSWQAILFPQQSRTLNRKWDKSHQFALALRVVQKLHPARGWEEECLRASYVFTRISGTEFQGSLLLFSRRLCDIIKTEDFARADTLCILVSYSCSIAHGRLNRSHDARLLRGPEIGNQNHNQGFVPSITCMTSISCTSSCERLAHLLG
jgi:hypothetical protein